MAKKTPATPAIEPPQHTNAEGQFVNSNQNPFPIPADLRGGVKKIDTRNPGKTKDSAA